MKGTIASFTGRIKFGAHRGGYEEVLELSKAIAKLRDLEKGRGDEERTALI